MIWGYPYFRTPPLYVDRFRMILAKVHAHNCLGMHRTCRGLGCKNSVFFPNLETFSKDIKAQISRLAWNYQNYHPFISDFHSDFHCKAGQPEIKTHQPDCRGPIFYRLRWSRRSGFPHGVLPKLLGVFVIFLQNKGTLEVGHHFYPFF